FVEEASDSAALAQREGSSFVTKHHRARLRRQPESAARRLQSKSIGLRKIGVVDRGKKSRDGTSAGHHWDNLDAPAGVVSQANPLKTAHALSTHLFGQFSSSSDSWI